MGIRPAGLSLFLYRMRMFILHSCIFAMMKKYFKYILFTLLLTSSAVVVACGEDDPSNQDPHSGQTQSVVITCDTESITAEASEQSFDIAVSVNKKEWTAFVEGADWITVRCDGTATDCGTVRVTIAENVTPKVRTASVVVKSGMARKVIPVTQAGAEIDNAIVGPEGYELVWHDEFDKNGSLNLNDWTHEIKPSGWVNRELQNYVYETTPGGAWVTRVKDDLLQIRALKENGKVYSGRVYAKVKEGWQYGYIEARIKLPKGKGTWPAFWMMPVHFTGWPKDGEIDIMEEVGANANYVSSSLHANAHVHSNGTQVTHEMYLKGAEDDFHTYSIMWSHENITTYVDGKVQLSYDNRGLGHDDWPYDAPFYVIFNLAWGGDWGGYKGVDDSALPTIMEVDYVRVFQK